jgi:hypothetical protein
MGDVVGSNNLPCLFSLSSSPRNPPTSKFIVLADNMRGAINMAWEHGGADFQSRFDKSTAQGGDEKRGVVRSVTERISYQLFD